MHCAIWFNAQVAGADAGELAGMSAFILEGNIQPLLPAIRAPTLLVYPEAGATASNDQCAIFLREIADVRVRHVPTPYHMVHLIVPRECSDAIKEFVLSRCER
jgi:pimeloyl-ACP methyl ester carboxylesterase